MLGDPENELLIGLLYAVYFACVVIYVYLIAPNTLRVFARSAAWNDKRGARIIKGTTELSSMEKGII